MAVRKGASKPARFTKATVDFLASAGEQTSPDWLDDQTDEHEQVLTTPLRELAQRLFLNLVDLPEARGYRFPKRGFGRLRRPSHKVGPGDVAYRSWVHLQASRPSPSRFDENPGLYFYLSPTEVFSGGGVYKPSSRQINKFRAWVAEDPTEMDQVLKSKAFKREFPRGFETEKILKTFPRSYPQDHPRIDWLRLQGFYIKRDYSKKELYSPDFVDLVTENWRQTLRFNAVLYEALNFVPSTFTPVKSDQVDDVSDDDVSSREELWDDRL